MKLLVALGLLSVSLVAGLEACSDPATSEPASSLADGGAEEDAASPGVDGGPSTPDPQSDAEAALPEPPATGNRAAIFVTSDVTSARSEHSAGAAFFTRTAADQSVTRKTVGPCVVETYGSGAGPKDTDRSAGKLTISGGAKSVPLLPEADGTYTTVNGQGALFAGGETLTITAQGAAVPAFVLSLVAPSKLTLASPALPAAAGALKVTRSAGLSASWTGSSAGVVVVYLDAAGGSSAHAATCSFPASAGAGVVPAAALADFPAVSGTFSIYAKTVAVQTPADEYIRATASTLLVGATGAGAAGDASFE